MSTSLSRILFALPLVLVGCKHVPSQADANLAQVPSAIQAPTAPPRMTAPACRIEPRPTPQISAKAPALPAENRESAAAVSVAPVDSNAPVEIAGATPAAALPSAAELREALGEVSEIDAEIDQATRSLVSAMESASGSPPAPAEAAPAPEETRLGRLLRRALDWLPTIGSALGMYVLAPLFVDMLKHRLQQRRQRMAGMGM